MTILAAAALRTHIETDLSDTALDRLGSAAESLILDVTGSLTVQSETLRTQAEQRLYTTRGVLTITSIDERNFPDDTKVTLSGDDYRLESGYRIVRLRQGTNPRLYWACEVTIVYVPDIDTAMVEGVQIELVRLAVVNAGAQRETHGDFDFWHQDRAAATKSAMYPLTSSRLRMSFR